MNADIGHQFGRLVMAVVDEPEAVDHNDLLEAASAFLHATSLSDERQQLARRIAYAAMDLAVFYTAAEYAKLRQLALVFQTQV